VRLLLDTQILVWVPLNDRRLSKAAVLAMQDADNDLHVSAAAGFEFAELQARGRFPVREPLEALAVLIGFELVDLPAETWRIASELPDIHRDPVDRMQVAHAILGNYTLVTADAKMRRYPVDSLW
jgi:PIN domain nuclease of toxin-antitoxin system